MLIILFLSPPFNSFEIYTSKWRERKKRRKGVSKNL